MNKRERLHAAFKRQPVDHTPIALWRHFPGDDLDARKFAARVIEFQKLFDFDFIKVTPAAAYSAEMYGAQLVAKGNREGTRNYSSRLVNDWRDWEKIRALDSSNAVFQRERQAMSLIRAGLGDDAPILQTIFSPLSIARNLRGDAVVQDLRAHPDELKHALDNLALTVIHFALDALSSGAHALFFASQMATRDFVTADEYREFGVTYDRLILDAVRGHTDFVLLHAHGENLYFDLLAQYPVECLNWHDRKTPPTLRQARDQCAGAMVGGIDEWNVLADGTPAQIQEQIRDAMAQTDGRGLILAPGCVIAIDTPIENIRAARSAVES